MSIFTRKCVYNFINKKLIINLENSYISKSQRCFSKSFTHFDKKKDADSKDLVVIDKLNKIQLIGINRPEKRNCINKATATALLNAFKEFDADDDSYVAVLYGKGGNFCAGYDLKEIAEGTEDSKQIFNEEQGPMGPTRYETKKPVFAAIEGYAVGGGFELALWCDYRIMEDTAIIGALNRRFGVPFIDGCTARLPAIVGMGRALDIIMTGRAIKVEEALQIGLVNKKCAVGTAIGQAVHVAFLLVGYPQEALRADRESARRAFAAPTLSEALLREHRRGILTFDEAKEGAKVFAKGTGKHGVIFNHIPEDFDEY